MSNPIPQSPTCHFQKSQPSQTSPPSPPSPSQSSQPSSFQPHLPQTLTTIWITNITNLYHIYPINWITKVTPKLTHNPPNPINPPTMPSNPPQPPFNWAYQSNNNPLPPLQYPLPPRPWMLPPRRPIPTAFYLQQIRFYRPGIPPDPYEHEFEPDEHPPNIYRDQISQFLVRISNEIFPILGVLFVGFGRAFWFLMEWLVFRPLRGIVWVVGKVEWEFVFALLAAARLAGFMPRPNGGRALESEGGMEVDGPVYVLVPEFRRWATGSCFQASRS